MNIHEFYKYMIIIIIMAVITILIIGYAIIKKDFSRRTHKLIIGIFIFDVLVLIGLALNACSKNFFLPECF